MVNVAQIGMGYWGPNLLRNLISNRDCEVKMVVDLDEDRRNFVKNLYPSVPVSNDVQSVLEDPSIQAVVIATPVKTHFDLTMQCLKRGKHALVEKPIATSIEEVDEIISISRKNKLVAMSGHIFIYNEAVRFLKRYIDSGELGDVRYIYSQRLNLGRIRSDVDALWNFAPHDISIIQYLLDDPSPLTIRRDGMAYVQDGIEDVVFLHIVYPKNIITNIHVSWLDPRRVRQMIVVGSKKMVIYDDIADNKIAIYDKGIDRMAILGQNMDFDNPNIMEFSYRSGDVLLPMINFKEPLQVEISHFLDCVKDGTKCLTGPAHARKVIEILST